MLICEVQTKKCSTCQVIKTWGEFHIRNEKPRSDCKICRCAKEVEFHKKSLHGVRARLKPIRVCPVVQTARRRNEIKTWKKKNAHHVAEYKAKYKEENKDKTNAQLRHKRKTNPKYAIVQRVRERLTHAFTTRSWKKTTHFAEYIGCTRDELYAHIESNFEVGMSWNNRSEWHIDHLMPISTAKTPKELYELCHYLNLKPLWKKDNLKKSNKITEASYTALANVRKARGIF